MKHRFWAFGAVVLACVLVFGACSASQANFREGKSANPQAADYYEMNGVHDSQKADASPSQEAPNGGFDIANDENAKIVWTGSVSMETTEWDATIAALQALFASYNVQIMSSNETGGTSYSSNGTTRKTAKEARFTLRVPSENFAAFMDGFAGIAGSVTNSSKSRADLTKQYNENELTLDLLRTEYEDLKKLLSKAANLSEIMMVRERMTEVMTEIKKLSQANNTIDYDVTYSRVSLSLREVLVYSDPGKSENWFVRFGKSFLEGSSDFFEFLGDVAIWFSGHIFYLILFALIFILPIFFIVHGVKKRRAKRAAAAEAVQQKVPEASEEAKA